MDIEEFKSVFLPLGPLLYRLAFRMLGAEEDARDAVQETFLKAWQHMDTFRAQSQAKTWLTRIAINVCRDMRRSKWFRHIDRRITPEMLPHAEVPPKQADLDFLCALRVCF